MFFGVYKIKKIPYTQCDIRCEKKQPKTTKQQKKQNKWQQSLQIQKGVAIVTTNTKGEVKQVGIPTT